MYFYNCYLKKVNSRSILRGTRSRQGVYSLSTLSLQRASKKESLDSEFGLPKARGRVKTSSLRKQLNQSLPHGSIS
jgi:hypothetical protein